MVRFSKGLRPHRDGPNDLRRPIAFLTVGAVAVVALFISRSIFGDPSLRGLRDVVDVVANAGAIVIPVAIIAVIWRWRLSTMHPEVDPSRPDATTFSIVRTEQMTRAMTQFGYDDELGAGLRATDFAAGLMAVADSFGMELWAASRSNPRLYFRIPWTDVESVAISEQHKYAIEIILVALDQSVAVPVEVVGPGRGVRRATRTQLEQLVLGLESFRTARSGAGPAPVARNSRLWKAVLEQIEQWDPAALRRRLGQEFIFEYDHEIFGVVESLHNGRTTTQTAEELTSRIRESFGLNVSHARSQAAVEAAEKRAAFEPAQHRDAEVS